MAEKSVHSKEVFTGLWTFKPNPKECPLTGDVHLREVSVKRGFVVMQKMRKNLMYIKFIL